MPPLAKKLAEAEELLDQGRLWEARDMLGGLRVSHGYDERLFALIARVALAMGDLPAAGAVVFLTGIETNAQQEALAAFRRRCGHDPVQMAAQSGFLKYWRDLSDRRLRALRDEFGEEMWAELKERHGRAERRRSSLSKSSASQGPPIAKVPGPIIFLVLLVFLFAFIGLLVVATMVRDAVQLHYF